MNRKKKQTKNKYTNNEERKIPSSCEIYRSLYNNGVFYCSLVREY